MKYNWQSFSYKFSCSFTNTGKGTFVAWFIKLQPLQMHKNFLKTQAARSLYFLLSPIAIATNKYFLLNNLQNKGYEQINLRNGSYKTRQEKVSALQMVAPRWNPATQLFAVPSATRSTQDQSIPLHRAGVQRAWILLTPFLSTFENGYICQVLKGDLFDFQQLHKQMNKKWVSHIKLYLTTCYPLEQHAKNNGCCLKVEQRTHIRKHFFFPTVRNLGPRRALKYYTFSWIQNSSVISLDDLLLSQSIKTHGF